MRPLQHLEPVARETIGIKPLVIAFVERIERCFTAFFSNFRKQFLIAYFGRRDDLAILIGSSSAE